MNPALAATLPPRSTPCGRFVYSTSPDFASTALTDALSRLQELIDSPSATLIAGGRNRNVRITLNPEEGPLDLVVKAFGAQSTAKDAIDSLRGSKARRSWLAANQLAANGVGTPEPVAYVERWEGLKLRESYFLTVYRPGVVSLNEALADLFDNNPECSEFMDLLNRVAATCRDMHDAGFAHFDLGNQNILMSPTSEGGYDNAQVIDLNRGRRKKRPLNIRQRARDLSRIDLPSGFLEIFIGLYLQQPENKRFDRWYGFYRLLFQLHARSRFLRHPIRERRRAREEKRESGGQRPGPRDLWVWDSKTAQAFSPLTRRERLASYPSGRSLRMLKDLALNALPVWRAYRRIKSQAFIAPVTLTDRLGMAVEPMPDTWEQERALLTELGKLPLLLRFYHQDSADQHAFLMQTARELHADGHNLKIALVQDREAVTNPASWAAFVGHIIDSIGESVSSVEVGHAINRVKWGIWGFDELARLYAPIAPLAARWPKIEFIGPATIDFEYLFTLSAIQDWPSIMPPTGLSLHLYVDRRGAPENPQTGFNSIDKFALARAISTSSACCTGKVVISEVNWPIDGTGSYSPIAPPTATLDDPVGIDEETYAAYMVRYLLLGIGSGFVDRIYWWRLVARGYGLVDDSVDGQWRRRTGFHAFATLLGLIGEASLVDAKLPPQTGERHGLYALRFQADEEQIVVAWAHGNPCPFPESWQFDRVENLTGNAVTPPAQIDGSPLYLRGFRS